MAASNEECPVCLEAFDTLYVHRVNLPCTHFMCNRCFTNMEPKCPLCRSPIDMDVVYSDVPKCLALESCDTRCTRGATCGLYCSKHVEHWCAVAFEQCELYEQIKITNELRDRLSKRKQEFKDDHRPTMGASAIRQRTIERQRRARELKLMRAREEAQRREARAEYVRERNACWFGAFMGSTPPEFVEIVSEVTCSVTRKHLASLIAVYKRFRDSLLGLMINRFITHLPNEQRRSVSNKLADAEMYIGYSKSRQKKRADVPLVALEEWGVEEFIDRYDELSAAVFNNMDVPVHHPYTSFDTLVSRVVGG